MLILGLDPGSQRTGYGLIDRAGSRLRPVAFGAISCPRGPLPGRLAHLGRELRAVVKTHAPDVAVLESLFRGVNSQSLIVLAQARGALITTLALEGIEIAEYAPAAVKTAVTGNGRADKTQVARMVRLLLGLGTERMTADTTDALAVAICYAQRLRIDRLQAAGDRDKGPEGTR